MTHVFKITHIAIATWLITIPLLLSAQTHEANLKPYLTKDVVAVAYIDLSKARDEFSNFLQAGQFLEQRDLNSLSELTKILDQARVELADEKATQCYFLFRTTDIEMLSTSVVVPVGQGKNVRRVQQVYSGLMEKFLSGMSGIKSVASRDAVFLSGTQTQLDRLQSAEEGSAKDIGDGLKAIGDGAVGLLAFGDADSRKVVAELFNKMPEPFESISGKMLAEKVDWMGIELQLENRFGLSLVFDCAESESAGELAKRLSSAADRFTKLPFVEQVLPTDKARESLKSQLVPKAEANRVTMAWTPGDDNFLLELASKQAQKVRVKAKESQEQNNIRQLMLAMHNYESAHGHMPLAAVKAKNGKSGLSWRVHILPFIEQGGLWKKFNLDEPWDSKQNLEAAKQMPAVFRSPLLPDLKQGHTVYQVPVSKEAFFKPNAKEPSGFKDMLDGSSNTIAIVTVDSSQAALWSKPVDWEVDAKAPHQGLRLAKEGKIFFARFDGFVSILPNDVDKKVLNAFITSAGEEVLHVDF